MYEYSDWDMAIMNDNYSDNETLNNKEEDDMNIGAIQAKIYHYEAEIEKALDNDDWDSYGYYSDLLNMALLEELHMEDE